MMIESIVTHACILFLIFQFPDAQTYTKVLTKLEVLNPIDHMCIKLYVHKSIIHKYNYINYVIYVP